MEIVKYNKPEIPEKWDCDKSIEKVKSFIYKWKNLTEEVAFELWIAREKLSSRYHRDGTKVPSWSQYCEDIGSSKQVINRWLKEWFEPEKLAHVSHATGENEWYTPPDIIEAARRTMGGIDCDPATSEKANESIKAEIAFTIKENGLNQTWNGNVWMNPPYSQPLISKFSEAMSSKFESGEINQACILVNNATETAWLQRMARLSSAICFISGRIKFIDMDGNSSGAPLQGQAILYMGMNVSRFTKNFLEKGLIFYAKREDSK